jgi:hypothetical protein
MEIMPTSLLISTVFCRKFAKHRNQTAVHGKHRIASSSLSRITKDLKETMQLCSPLSERALTQECKIMWDNIQDIVDQMDETHVRLESPSSDSFTLVETFDYEA